MARLLLCACRRSARYRGRSRSWRCRSLNGFMALPTAAALPIAGAVFLSLNRNRGNEQPLMSELVDQHVATLTSANPCCTYDRRRDCREVHCDES
jgi:hypothetical protein